MQHKTLFKAENQPVPDLEGSYKTDGFQVSVKAIKQGNGQ